MTPLNYQNRNDAQNDFWVLPSMFRPSKKEAWRQLAEQVHGQFVEGGFFRKDKVVATAEQWTVTLDTYNVSNGETSSTYTRVRAPFMTRDNFRFTIYRANLFTRLGELLGMRDIRIGDAAFDEAFVIKANNEQKVRALLSNRSIRELMNAQPRIRVEVKDDEGWFGAQFPQGVDELYFSSPGVLKDLNRLRGIFDLFTAILQQLCHIGSAHENDPGVRL